MKDYLFLFQEGKPALLKKVNSNMLHHQRKQLLNNYSFN